MRKGIGHNRNESVSSMASVLLVGGDIHGENSEKLCPVTSIDAVLARSERSRRYIVFHELLILKENRKCGTRMLMSP